MNQSNKFIQVKNHFESFGYRIVDFDFKRPWGGFLVIDEKQAKNLQINFLKTSLLTALKLEGNSVLNCLLSIQMQDSHGNITIEEPKSGGYIKELLVLSDPKMTIKNHY